MFAASNALDGFVCIFCCFCLVGGLILALAKEAFKTEAGSKLGEGLVTYILGRIFKQ